MADGDAAGDRLLDGITVLDLTTFVTGGFASLMLANQGAEVIKVERPDVGDDNRYSGPPFVEPGEYDGPGVTAADRGESPYFWTVNYGKRSVELDLKTEGGLEALYRLAETADVFIENFRPGTAERIGVGYDDIRERNPDVVYCSISAFGETGPWRERPGYDLLVQGTGGVMDVTGPEGGDPVKIGMPATDLITAMWSAFGIVSALHRRSRGGGGDRIEIGMHDAVLPWLTKQAGRVFAGETPERMGTRDPVLAPYQAFPTADGYLNVGCANQKLWTELCEAIDREDLLEDPRFADNAARVEHMDELEAELTATFEERPTEEWVELLADEHGIPVGPVLSVRDALYNEQTEARGVIGEVEHPSAGEIPVVEHPLNFERAESGFEGAPPLLGEDTVDALLDAGYTPEEIAHLEAVGAIPDR